MDSRRLGGLPADDPSAIRGGIRFQVSCCSGQYSLLGIHTAQSLPGFLRQVTYFIVTPHREALNGLTAFLDGGVHFFSPPTHTYDG